MSASCRAWLNPAELAARQHIRKALRYRMMLINGTHGRTGSDIVRRQKDRTPANNGKL